MEKAKILYKFDSGTKNGKTWKGCRINATSEEDGKVYKGILWADKDDISDFVEAE